MQDKGSIDRSITTIARGMNIVGSRYLGGPQISGYCQCGVYVVCRKSCPWVRSASVGPGVSVLVKCLFVARVRRNSSGECQKFAKLGMCSRTGWLVAYAKFEFRVQFTILGSLVSVL